jgi:hypothetical protein
MSETTTTATDKDEQEALAYVARIKGFYEHLWMFAGFAIVFLGAFGVAFGFERPPVQFLPFAFAGWAFAVAIHGLRAYEVIDLLSPNWERRLVERRLGHKLH